MLPHGERSRALGGETMGDSRRCRHWRTRRFGPFDNGVREDKDEECEENDEKEGMLYDYYFLRKQASGGKKCWARLGKGFYALC